MEQYHVTGMSCAACSARVEKAVSKVEGVSSCSVSLLTNSMGVEGEAPPEEIIRAVEEAGYGASLKNGTEEMSGGSKSQTDDLQDRETPLLRKRLFASLVFLLVLMYFSMGHMMWGWPAPARLADNPLAMGLLQLLLTAVVMVINQKFFISGFQSLYHRAPNMDTLVAMGSGAAFIYSTYALFAMTEAQMRGDSQAVMHCMHEFYFESAAMILTLITVGKMLEAHSKGKTTDALKSLMRLAPQTAVVIRNGAEVTVDIAQVRKGDHFVVRPGESIPVDGVVLEGSSAVNEAALTGESIPADKGVGDGVSAGTVNQSGFLRCEASRVGEDTTLSQIIRMVSDAAATKAPIAKVADRVSGVFVPAVIFVAVITTVVWLLAGQEAGFALARGISVLVISCPCALGLATPVAIMVGSGVGARNGILFKTAVSLEETGKADIVVLDKTGTITAGEPAVTDVIAADDFSVKQLLEDAYSLERQSEHPLARAVISYGEQEEIRPHNIENFNALPGNGLSATMNGVKLTGGSLSFTSGLTAIPETLATQAERLSEEGKTPLLFTRGGRLTGMIAVADRMKEESPEAVQQLRDMGIRVVMLTGDNERTARAVGERVGVDEVIAGVLPDGKESVIRSLKEQGRVIMVGDGINDAPALTRADIGVAIGAGTDVAIDAADVVLMKSRLSDVPAAVRLSRAALRNIHQNLFWAFFYNVIGIPLAAGVWIPIFGWKLNPMFGAAAMSLSSFCVVTNALRLNLQNGIHPRNMPRDNVPEEVKNKTGVDQIHLVENEGSVKNKSFTRENCVCAHLTQSRHAQKTCAEMRVIMTKTMKIEGMMCGHCEARVKKALEALEQVTEAKVSHESGQAVVSLQEELPDDVLRNAVEEQDYQVIAIEA